MVTGGGLVLLSFEQRLQGTVLFLASLQQKENAVHRKGIGDGAAAELSSSQRMNLALQANARRIVGGMRNPIWSRQRFLTASLIGHKQTHQPQHTPEREPPERYFHLGTRVVLSAISSEFRNDEPGSRNHGFGRAAGPNLSFACVSCPTCKRFRGVCQRAGMRHGLRTGGD